MSDYKCPIKTESFDCMCCDEDLCARNKAYQQGATDMEKSKQIVIDALGNVIDTYREKIFYLMNKIDALSVERNLDGLRALHYEDMEWIKNSFLTNEYYDYFIEKLKEQK